jgi:hypothetical protein
VIFELHAHVTAPDGTDYRTMRYAYNREVLEDLRLRWLKANENTINTVDIEIIERVI